jgi:hypothetical protein
MRTCGRKGKGFKKNQDSQKQTLKPKKATGFFYGELRVEKPAKVFDPLSRFQQESENVNWRKICKRSNWRSLGYQ